jgi:hypothetical protein
VYSVFLLCISLSGLRVMTGMGDKARPGRLTSRRSK